MMFDYLAREDGKSWREELRAAAEHGMRRALAHFDRPGCDQPARHISGTMTDLAHMLRSSDDGLAEAEELYRRSLVIAREGCGAEHAQIHRHYVLTCVRDGVYEFKTK